MYVNILFIHSIIQFIHLKIIFFFQHNSCQSSLDELSIKQEQLTLKEEMISDLQEELVKVRLRDAENEATIRDLKDKIGELEHVST